MSNLAKAEEHAKAKAEEIKKSQEVKETEAKAQETKKESTDAATKSEDKKDDVKKTEGNKDSGDDTGKTTLEDAEKKAEEEAKLLDADDKDLSDEDKTRKAELVKAREDKLTPEDKIKRTQEKTQQRIDEVISELKAERAERQQDKDKIAQLEAKLSELTKPKEEETKASKIQSLYNERISKYLDEDKNKPREQRREMSREELEEWLLEDMVSAQDWMIDRNLRRSSDRKEVESFLVDKPKQDAEEFIRKQSESLAKLEAKFPGIRPSKERLAELKGKSASEIDEILSAESEDYKLMLDVVKSDHKKYMESVDGPEQVMAEMERRKASKGKVTLSQDELDKLISEKTEAELQRRASLDETPSSGGKKKVDKKEQKTQFRLKQEEIAKKAGISSDDLDNAIKRRESIGAVASSATEFNQD